MRSIAIAAAVGLLTLPYAGCIENMRDLKDRLTGGSEAVEKTALDDANSTVGKSKTNLTNATKRLKPPVARISVYAANGALVYKASFIAENETEAIIADGGTFKLVGADSEPIEPGATITKFAWTVDGTGSEGRRVEVNLSSPGMHVVTLQVTDSKGSTDAQTIRIGVPAVPFDETWTATGAQAAGVATPAAFVGQGSPQTFPFTILATKDGKTLKASNLRIVLGAPPPDPFPVGQQPADFTVTVTDPAGTVTTANAEPPDFEALSIDAVPAGDWTAQVDLNAGAAQGFTLAFTVTYVEVVEGLGDGHGHAH